MKKKKTISRLLAAALSVAMMTSSLVSGTMAKFTSSASASDSARVAYWGIELAGEALDLFSNQYETDGTSAAGIAYSVESATGDDVIAPGTTKTASFEFISAGDKAPEVAYTLSVDVSESSIAKDLRDNPNIVWKLDDGSWESWNNLLGHIRCLSGDISGIKDYEPNEMPASMDHQIHTVSFKWNFSETEEGDAYDTLISNKDVLDLVNLSIVVSAEQRMGEFKSTATDEEGNPINVVVSAPTGAKEKAVKKSLSEEDTGLTADQIENAYVVLLDTEDTFGTANVRFDVSGTFESGADVLIMHYDESAGAWETIAKTSVDGSGIVEGSFSSFSPVVFISLEDEEEEEKEERIPIEYMEAMQPKVTITEPGKYCISDYVYVEPEKATDTLTAVFKSENPDPSSLYLTNENGKCYFNVASDPADPELLSGAYCTLLVVPVNSETGEKLEEPFAKFTFKLNIPEEAFGPKTPASNCSVTVDPITTLGDVTDHFHIEADGSYKYAEYAFSSDALKYNEESRRIYVRDAETGTVSVTVKLYDKEKNVLCSAEASITMNVVLVPCEVLEFTQDSFEVTRANVVGLYDLREYLNVTEGTTDDISFRLAKDYPAVRLGGSDIHSYDTFCFIAEPNAEGTYSVIAEALDPVSGEVRMSDTIDVVVNLMQSSYDTVYVTAGDYFIPANEFNSVAGKTVKVGVDQSLAIGMTAYGTSEGVVNATFTSSDPDVIFFFADAKPEDYALKEYAGSHDDTVSVVRMKNSNFYVNGAGTAEITVTPNCGDPITFTVVVTESIPCETLEFKQDSFEVSETGSYDLRGYLNITEGTTDEIIFNLMSFGANVTVNGDQLMVFPGDSGSYTIIVQAVNPATREIRMSDTITVFVNLV